MTAQRPNNLGREGTYRKPIKEKVPPTISLITAERMERNAKRFLDFLFTKKDNKER